MGDTQVVQIPGEEACLVRYRAECSACDPNCEVDYCRINVWHGGEQREYGDAVVEARDHWKYWHKRQPLVKSAAFKG